MDMDQMSFSSKEADASTSFSLEPEEVMGSMDSSVLLVMSV